MTATIATLVIDGADISNRVIGADIWMEDKFYIGHADIYLMNINNEFGGVFNSGDLVTLELNNGDGSDEMFVGLLDDARMDVMPDFVNRTVFKVSARIRPNLAQLYYTGGFPDGTHNKADDVIEYVLDQAQTGLDPSEKITYVSSSVTSELEVRFNRTYLNEKFKEIANRLNWNGYQDFNQVLHFFAEGSAGAKISVLTLKSVNGATDNNILDFKEKEQLGKDIWNYIEMFAGPVKDHWTEPECYADYTPLTGCTVVGEDSLKVGFNKGSLKFEGFTTDSETGGWLLFPIYNYTSIDLYEPADNYFWVYHDSIAHGYASIRPMLMDRNGTKIEYYRANADELGMEHGPTEYKPAQYWWQIRFPTGVEKTVEIENTVSTETWRYKIRPYAEAAIQFTSAALSNVSGRGYIVLTAIGAATPFLNFVEGGYCVFSDCEDAGNNGTYTIDEIVDGTHMYLTTTFATPNASDSALTVTTPTFDWEYVTGIGFYGKLDTGFDMDVYIDFLSLPNVEVISIVESVSSSVLYGKKMIPEYHPEVISQLELDDIANDLLEKSKWPLVGADAVVIGSRYLQFASLSIDVNAPPYGITTDEYRIRTLHHVIRLGGIPGFPGEDWVTELELMAQTVSGSSQEVAPKRLRFDASPLAEATVMLRDQFHRMSMAAIPDSAGQTFVRVPGDGELAGFVTFDTHANRPASGAFINELYYETDTKVWFYWDGAAWTECTRAEAKMRLAQFTERLHDSTTSVSSDQHHNQSHKARHSTSGGVDALDTASDGSHSHGFTTSNYSIPSSFDRLYAAPSSGASPTIAFYAVATYADQPLLQAISNDGSHNHDVTSSPSPDVIDDNEKPMVRILEHKIVNNQQQITVEMPEFNYRESTLFPITADDKRIMKQLKQTYHNLWEQSKKPPNMKIEKILTGRNVRWDRDVEKSEMEEKLADDGLSGWRDVMEKNIKDKTAHPDDIKRYNDMKEKSKKPEPS